MSLFGTSPEDTPRRNVKSSLFDDEAPARQGGSGLFADDPPDNANDSPWGFPTPRRQARGNPVKTLLSGVSVPDGYIDAYDALLENGESAGNNVSLAGVRRLLAASATSTAQQQETLKIVLPQGEEVDGLGRAEFNVMLALVGLAQEGEDISLDGVDERKRRLPQTRLPQLRAPRPPPQQSQPTPAPPTTPSAPRDAAPSHSEVQPSYSYSADSDPWGTSAPKPAAQYSANGNGASASIPQRTTSTFTTTDDDTPSVPSETPIAIRTNSEWASYNGSTTGTDYDQAGGFANVADRSIADLSTSRISRAMGASTRGLEEIVTVNAIPEKEGMFLFQHRNYEVASHRRNSKVIRRYSDFVWLLDCLHKKYPFRQLPLLPPKRVAINGNHIATDTLFLLKRRRGLSRFLTALLNHPILSQDQLVTMFLTVPSDLGSWRKSAALTIAEEFDHKPLPADLEASLPGDLETNLFPTVRAGVQKTAATYISLCSLLERLIKRNEGLAADHSRLATSLASLTELSAEIYAADTNDVPLLNDGLNATARHVDVHRGLLLEEARVTEDVVLEDLKSLRDAAVAMRDLFDRLASPLARTSIPALEKRIAGSEAKLAATRAKPDAQRKPGDAEKIEEAIVKDREEVKRQYERSIFVKECVRDEIGYWNQGMVRRVGGWVQGWVAENVKSAEMVASNWRALSEGVEAMVPE